MRKKMTRRVKEVKKEWQTEVNREETVETT